MPLYVVIAELPARAEVPEQVAVAHELREILVARDEGRAHALPAHEVRQRADDVVGLVLRIHERREPEAAAELPAVPELQHEVGGRALAVGLVRSEERRVGKGCEYRGWGENE